MRFFKYFLVEKLLPRVKFRWLSILKFSDFHF